MNATELRTAAAKLREMAKPATPGPWFTADCELYPRWVLSATATEGESGYAAYVAKSYSDDDGLDVSDADWQWMAFASPALAEPLAAWLELTADYPRGMANSGRALDVARVVNGTAPAPSAPVPSAGL
ncbi:hypothetical protein FHR32_005097 [Streptosporangium album]|uniref:Uncharacterized protein n=1 Tax=Streptosporangium album TaxID=47479 RepID=A0A7W7RYR5_9ACTN|nr:hypothetical protein [Streptosporangium album]MBB4940720.1 hypothetical protein [Streptosporangium album]